ncbi:MAG: hypothetical protein A2V66_01455 [Ignavibacteria bacterium RBG_13_36_8]|nr:MAG: hypothetical protein A2V66_01455 [Ignavibacteria bacterium RBG_13_36_8]
MLDLDTLEYDILYIALIIFLASFIQGFTGFGFAIISIPLLSLIINIKEAIPLAALAGLIINIFLLAQLNKHIKFSELKSLLIGSFIGIPIGAYFLTEADPKLIKIILGLIILVFVFFSLTKIIKRTELNLKWGYLFGTISGVLGGAFNTNGPPILIYFYLKGWDKFKQKASITGFFVVTSIIIVSTHALTGITTAAVLSKFLVSLPAVFIGMFIGSRFFIKISTDTFNRVILYGLILIAIFMIFR